MFLKYLLSLQPSKNGVCLCPLTIKKLHYFILYNNKRRKRKPIREEGNQNQIPKPHPKTQKAIIMATLRS